jgi:competence ComEA-like helix-hairpin-helix protein
LRFTRYYTKQELVFIALFLFLFGIGAGKCAYERLFPEYAIRLEKAHLKHPHAYPLDVNTASYEALLAVPGIGKKTASRIVAYRASRRFTAVDELTRVQGIGAKKLERLKQYLDVR